MKRFLVIIFCFLNVSIFSSISMAAGWSSFANITDFQLASTTNFLVKLDAVGLTFGHSCTNTSGWFRIYHTDVEAGKSILATALTAHAMGRQVRIFSNACSSVYPNITTIQIQ